MLGPVAAWEHLSLSCCWPGAVAHVSGQKYPPHPGLSWAEVLSAADLAPMGSHLQSKTELGDVLQAFKLFPVSLGCRKTHPAAWEQDSPPL